MCLKPRDADSLELTLEKLAVDPTTLASTTEIETTVSPVFEVETIELEAETLWPTIFVPATELIAPTLETTADVETKVETMVDVEATELETQTLSPTLEVPATEVIAPTLETTDDVETMVEIFLPLHDGFERPINRPINEALQEICYSGSLQRHTLKNVLLYFSELLCSFFERDFRG